MNRDEDRAMGQLRGPFAVFMTPGNRSVQVGYACKDARLGTRRDWRAIISVGVWLALALIATMTSTGATAADVARKRTGIADREWYRWPGHNFTLYSAARPWVTRPLWTSLQRFTVTIPRVAAFAAEDALPPVEVFLFDRPLERNRLLDLGAGDTPVTSSARGVTAAIATTSQRPLTGFKIAYARLLFRSGDSAEYPLWYEAGLTRYLGRMYDEDDELRINVRLASYLLFDRGSRMKDVVRYDEAAANEHASNSHRDVAFALYHLLKHRVAENAVPFSDATRAYLERWRAGVDLVEAFEASYGIPLRKLNAEGKRYHVAQGGGELYFPIHASDPRYVEPEPERLSRSEAAFHLARLALEFDRSAEARRFLEESLDGAARDHVVAAQCKLARLRADTMEAGAIAGLFGSLAAPSAANPGCMLDEGLALLTAAERDPGAASAGPIARRARELALLALQARPESAEALALYGRSFLVPGETTDAAIEPLQRAVQLAWLDSGIGASLMHAYAASGRHVDALRAAHNVLQWSHPRSEHYQAARTLLLERATRDPRTP
jgi:tetratricopeptide (TPR) repeat protein